MLIFLKSKPNTNTSSSMYKEEYSDKQSMILTMLAFSTLLIDVNPIILCHMTLRNTWFTDALKM